MQPVDASTPNVARAYDCLLGGRDHFAADRALAAKILEIYPLAAELTRENRAFLADAVGYVARRGVSQFIDVGAGLPTRPNVHEAACEVVPSARVAYIDNDPAVIAHARGLLRATGGVRLMAGDLSEPEALLASTELASMIDLSQPACLILTMVLHFLDAGTARAVAGVLTRGLAPGSYAIVSGAVGEGVHGRDHSPDEIAAFFGGLDLVEPGLVDARAWPSGASSPSGGSGGSGESGLPERAGYVLCGVGYKPPR